MTASELDDLSLQEKNILIYIGGYIVRKLSAKACEPCRTLISSEISPTDPDHTFLRTKNFAEAKIGLQAPTSVLATSLQLMEKGLPQPSRQRPLRITLFARPILLCMTGRTEKPKDGQVQPFIVVAPEKCGRYYGSTSNKI